MTAEGPNITASENFQLPEEFHNATEIKRFYRFAIEPKDNDVNVYFGLEGVDGKNRYFKCNLDTISKLTAEFSGLSYHSQLIASGDPAKRHTLAFETSMAFTMVPSGNNTEGCINFIFQTPSGQSFETLIGPNLSMQLWQSLDLALSGMPRPPEMSKGGAYVHKVKGELDTESEVVTYFGQEYPVEIIQALGVLMVRANLVEHCLVALLSKVSGTSFEKAGAIFFSSSNAKARLDMIRALADIDQDKNNRKNILELLETANKLYLRRNELVHGTWKFDKDKFVVEAYRPASKNKVKKIPVTAKDIENLAKEFRDLSFLISVAAQK